MSMPTAIPAAVSLEAPPAPQPTATARILHVINGEHYSGAERVQDLLAEHLLPCGFEVGFACLKPMRFPTSRKWHDAPIHRVDMRGRFDLSTVGRLAELIREHQYSLVHAHTPRSVLVSSMTARRTGVPLVYHVHSPASRDSTRRLQNYVNALLESWSSSGASRLIAVSPTLEELMVMQGVEAKKIVYVPNGVPAVDGPTREMPSGVWTLGIAALFRPRKGLEVLIEALTMLRSQGRSIRLRAIGPFETTEYEQEILRLVDRLGVAEAIDWTGFVDDIHAELRQVDLFTLPSLFGEGLPMVVLEAMAAGIPVVASHVEGVPVAVRHRREGLLVEPGSVSQLAQAIQEMIVGEKVDYRQLAENARQRHARYFSASAMASSVAEVYREVLTTT